MCGIAGFLYFDDRAVDEQLLRRMSDVQRHRGPDESGVYAGRRCGLGHRRLSIIDLATGRQPLSNEDGTVWIAFNGEIYNYRDLYGELSDLHVFRTRSDTETIVHLYESDPDGFVGRLRGMFAFALWDESRQTLILARDRVGKKPLYYYRDDEKLVFGSEIKAILEHPDLDLEIDDFAVSDYLSVGYIPSPRSIYRRIRKVEPGHYLKVTRGSLEEHRYWNLQFCADTERREEEWIEMLRTELRTAVDIRLMSEVPLGAFLSGGLDSSAVVAVMASTMDSAVKTATIRFLESDFDESDYARQVSRHLGTDHYERAVTPDAIATIEKLAWHYDEPFADASALPTYFVSKVARERVTVSLSGDGGDENFAGYRRYLFDRYENYLRSFLPLAIRRTVFGPQARAYPKMDWAPRPFRAKSTFQSLSHDPLEGYFETMSIFRGYEKPSILAPDFRRRLAGYQTVDVFRRHYDSSGSEDPLSRIQYLDIKTYLTDDILTKVDRASMANSLEVRCPLLDHRLMELAASMPSDFKLRGKTGKYILKKTVEPLLPPITVNRRKMGFGVPLADWFRGGILEYARSHLLEREDPFISSACVRKMWDQHQTGVRDRSEQLWCVLMFRLWHQRFAR